MNLPFITPCSPRRTRLGFSLVEMLVTMSIITMLGVLILPALQRARLSALRSTDLGNLKQVGVAIFAYAGENDQRMPGPTPTGQRPIYHGTDRVHDAPFLAFYLAPYLGCPIPATTSSATVVCPPLLSAGVKALKGATAFNEINYQVNYGTTNLPGDAVANWRRSIFGSISYSPPIDPAKIPNLAQAVNMSETWMMCNVDQACTAPSTMASGWFRTLPLKPVHGNTRNFLYLDGHAEAVPTTVQP